MLYTLCRFLVETNFLLLIWPTPSKTNSLLSLHWVRGHCGLTFSTSLHQLSWTGSFSACRGNSVCVDIPEIIAADLHQALLSVKLHSLAVISYLHSPHQKSHQQLFAGEALHYPISKGFKELEHHHPTLQQTGQGSNLTSLVGCGPGVLSSSYVCIKGRLAPDDVNHKNETKKHNVIDHLYS